MIEELSECALFRMMSISYLCIFCINFYYISLYLGYGKAKVVELKDWIQRRGIKTSGKRKADLVKSYV